MESIITSFRDSTIDEVDTFVDSNKQSSIDDMNRLVAFSDDDSTFSTEEEEEDERLLTPPLDIQHQTQLDKNPIEEELKEIDWEFWSKIISDYNRLSQSETRSLSIQVQHGIPSALRGTIWPLLAKKPEEGLQDRYIELLKQESVYEKAITRDLHRTFPNHPYFQSSQGQESLFNVVKAYSLYDEQLGYCQGLAFVAGPLLLNMPEEEAFCILVQLMNRYELRGHFTPQMDLLRERLYQFDGLLQDYLPHVYRHFNEQGVKSNMYVSQWFLTLFAYKFPLDVVFRIYDILFIEGFYCLFRIGLALLSKNQSTILSLEFEALVTFLKDDMLTIYNDDITDLLSESYRVEISPRRLERLAKEHQSESAKADTEAEMMESLRQKNKKLAESLKSVTLESKNISNEHALVASELITKKMELARVHDENDALKQQVVELRKVLDVIPAQIEAQVQSDMDKLCHKNQELTQRNAQLQDQLADMEALVIEMKMKYAQSESERELLRQKLTDLKRWMNNV